MSTFPLTCAALLQAKNRVEQIWNDPQAVTEYTAEVGALTTIMARQTAKFQELQDPQKDKSIRVMWLTDCNDDDAADCSNECNTGGQEIDDRCQDYALDMCLTKGFNVREKIFRSSTWDFQEVIARSFLLKMKSLDEQIVQTVIAKLDAEYTGVNQAPDPYSVSGRDTIIPAYAWTPELFAYLQQTLILNRMKDAYGLSGSNLFQASQLAKWNTGNANGPGTAAAFGSVPISFDLWNIDSVLGAKKTFFLRPGSVAFVSKNYYGPTPVQMPGSAAKVRYSIASRNLPGVVYDVVMDTACSNDEYTYKWSLFFKGGFFVNPKTCNNENTGILSFKCG